MTRSSRQSKILNLIASRPIDTQEELCRLLREEGFNVTQATVSRDIRELGLVKTADTDGNYRYATKKEVGSDISGRVVSVLRDYIVSIVAVENLVVVRTVADCAQLVSSALRQCQFPDVVAAVADRDTVLVVCMSVTDANAVTTKINNIL